MVSSRSACIFLVEGLKVLMILDRPGSTLQQSANHEPSRLLVIIEKQLKRCFEHPLKLGVEYDAHGAFRARSDGMTVTLESCQEAEAVSNEYEKKIRNGHNSPRFAPILCLNPFLNERHSRETVCQLDGERRRWSCKGSIWTSAFDDAEV